MTTPDTSNQKGAPMWPSPEVLSRLYDLANAALIGSLIVGVAATVTLVWSSNRKEAYLRREIANTGRAAAVANQRAAEAQLALERFKAQRALTPEQWKDVGRALSGFKRQRVPVAPIPETFEATVLANEIISALMDSGAEMVIDMNPGAALRHVGPVKGVLAVTTTGNEQGERFASMFATAMTRAGVQASWTTGLMEDLIKNPEERHTEYRSWVIIVVGDKP